MEHRVSIFGLIENYPVAKCKSVSISLNDVKTAENDKINRKLLKVCQAITRDMLNLISIK